MLRSVKALTQRNLTEQRNMLAAFSAVLVLFCVFLFILVLKKEEKILVIPASFSKSFWVQGDYMSENGLEEMSEFMVSLLLDYTPHTVSYKSEKALKYVSPSLYEGFQEELIKKVKFSQQEGYSRTFQPQTYNINAKTKEVIITGLDREYTGLQGGEAEQNTYYLRFSGSGGRQQLEEFKLYEK